MIKKIQQYLLTRHPLLWNTRFVWMISGLILLHVLFFISGYFRYTLSGLTGHFSISNVGQGNLYLFSILCSLAIIIAWAIFYLRNNAFKNFYIIGPFHSAKEFIQVFVILFLSISLLESFQWGAWFKTRRLTSKEQLVQEVNTFNIAAAFIPQNTSRYFKLNRCDADLSVRNRFMGNGEAFLYDSSSLSAADTVHKAIRRALLDPDAFSYRHYCKTEIDLPSYKGFLDEREVSTIVNRWLDGRHRDSILAALNNVLKISVRYGVGHRVDPAALADRALADSISMYSPVIEQFDSYLENGGKNNYYFAAFTLGHQLSFIDECYYGDTRKDNREDRVVFELYFALYAAILVFCYRRFNKRVFLFSLVGTLVWALIFGLIGTLSYSESINGFYVSLFVFITIAALLLLNRQSSKFFTGILINWHIYLAPILLILVGAMIIDQAQEQLYHLDPGHNRDAYFAKHFPVAFWLSGHEDLVLRLNLLFVFLYIIFCFTRLTKKWHIMPEE